MVTDDHQHGLSWLDSLYVHTISRTVWYDNDDDSSSQRECNADVHAVRAVLCRSHTRDIADDITKRDHRYVVTDDHQHGLSWLDSLYVHTISRTVWYDNDDDSSSQRECNADVHAVRAVLCRSHTRDIADDITKRDHRYVVTDDHQHGLSWLDSLYVHTISRTVWYDNDDDSSSQRECNADVHAVRAVLCRSHTRDIADDITKRDHRYVVTDDHQHGLSWLDSLYVHTISRTVWYDNDDDSSSQRECNADVHAVRAVLCRSHTRDIADDITKRDHRYVVTDDHQHGLSWLDSLYVHTISRTVWYDNDDDSSSQRECNADVHAVRAVLCRSHTRDIADDITKRDHRYVVTDDHQHGLSWLDSLYVHTISRTVWYDNDDDSSSQRECNADVHAVRAVLCRSHTRDIADDITKRDHRYVVTDDHQHGLSWLDSLYVHTISRTVWYDNDDDSSSQRECNADVHAVRAVLCRSHTRDIADDITKRDHRYVVTDDHQHGLSWLDSLYVHTISRTVWYDNDDDSSSQRECNADVHAVRAVLCRSHTRDIADDITKRDHRYVVTDDHQHGLSWLDSLYVHTISRTVWYDNDDDSSSQRECNADVHAVRAVLCRSHTRDIADDITKRDHRYVVTDEPISTSISATTTYYVDATDNGCTTLTRTAVTATVNTVPTITGTTPDSRCGTGTVTLGATASAGTINWYAATTGGSSLGTGTSYTTPSISSTTTYYVDATSGSCTTASRTSVTATINAVPATPTQTVDCSLGFGQAVVTVTGPLGAGYEYRLDAGTYQTGTSFYSSCQWKSYDHRA